jgi:hypothetical protein
MKSVRGIIDVYGDVSVTILVWELQEPIFIMMPKADSFQIFFRDYM